MSAMAGLSSLHIPQIAIFVSSAGRSDASGSL